jgi:hypothetical protein
LAAARLVEAVTVNKRIRRLAIVFLIIGLAIFIVLVAFPSPWVEWRRASAEAESFEVLAKASTVEELTEAVGYLGVFLKTRAGDWLAVRYRDSHAGRIWSSAVVRDSAGKWYTSDFHFCGRFQMYRHRRAYEESDEVKQSPDLLDVGRMDPDPYHDLRAIEAAPDLTAARQILERMGFHPVQPPGG